MENKYPTYHLLVKRLGQFRNAEKRNRLYKAFLWFCVTVMWITLFSGGIEFLFKLSTNIRGILLAVTVTGVVVSFFYFLLQPVASVLNRHNPSLYKIAAKVGKFYNGIDDKIVNALQLYEKRQDNKENYSLALLEAAILNVSEKLEHEKFSNKIDKRPFHQAVRIFIISFIVCLSIYTVLINHLNPAFVRLVHPKTSYQLVDPVHFQIWPKDTTLIKGKDLTVKCIVDQQKDESLILQVMKDKYQQDIELQLTKDDTFRYTFTTVRDSFRYAFRYGKQTSKVYAVSVHEFPLLRSLTLKVVPPAYSGLQPFLLEENVGDFSALKGSSIEISGSANKNLHTASVEIGNNKSVPLNIKDNRVNGRFVLQENITYSFKLLDFEGFTNQNPIKYRASVLVDQYPFIEIVVPGKDIDLTEEMQIPLLIRAEDDFGLSKMVLGYQVLTPGQTEPDSSRYIFSQLPLSKPDLKTSFNFNWDLTESEMLPTDVLVYFAGVYDNDNISGPKFSQSKIFRARFPSLVEMYQSLENQHDKAADEMENMYEKSKEIKSKMDDLARELNKSKEMDWQQQQELEKALENKKQMQKELKEMSDIFQEMIENMEKNELVSKETLEKYEQLQDLLKDIMTPELQEAMKKISEGMKDIDPEMMQKAMEEFKTSEEEFQKSLERSISLLKKLKIEQKLDQAIKLSKEISDELENASNDMANEKADDNKTMQKQQQMKNDSQALSDLLQELQQDMKEFPTMPQDDVKKASDQMNADQHMQNLENMQNQMQQGQMQEASKSAMKAIQTMQNISMQLMNAKQRMNGEMQKKTTQALMKSKKQLAQISKMQESLIDETNQLSNNMDKVTETAEKQHQIQSGVKRITDLLFETSKKSMSVSPKTSRALGQSLEKMESSLRALEERKTTNAATDQKSAMAALNMAVHQIQSTLQSMMQGQSPSGMGFQQFMDQMQQLAKGQQGINQQTMGLGSKMSLAQQAAMSRLASEQNRIRKSMQELANEAGQVSDVLGDMDAIINDMEKVEKDFVDKNVTRMTLERQNRILSRMLDAQRSIREREYSRKRKAETGKEYLAKSPDDLPKDLGERRNKLYQDLLRAKKEGYTKDYLELVKKYFEALNKNAVQNSQ